MLSSLSHLFAKYNQRSAPVFIVGFLRILYAMVALQEIFFLLYFNHLIFDPIPYIDVEFPMIPLFLVLWAGVATCLLVGYKSQQAIIANYIFWIVFVNFTPMQRDFDGGFDLFMIGVGLFMIFMPLGRALSVDNLIYKLQFKHQNKPEISKDVSVLVLIAPVLICLGFLYFDSAIHKLFAEHWRNGLGGWLPSSMPYYISALDMAWLLNMEWVQKSIGYIILIFQFSFIFLFYRRNFRPLFLLVGAVLHAGITITFNIYPFGLGMLSMYVLMVPFSWWQNIANCLVYEEPKLTVYYDGDCPLCNRTVIILHHLDVLQAVSFKDLQTYGKNEKALAVYEQQKLLLDLYAVDSQSKVYSGVDTYSQILVKMRYLAIFGWVLRTPGIYQLAKLTYRNIADKRERITCDDSCLPEGIKKDYPLDLYTKIFENYAANKPRHFRVKLAKIFVMIVLLQLNSSLHYGIFHRLYDFSKIESPLVSQLRGVSNSILMLSTTFMGITPHALYLHDHFEGYEDLIAITYIDNEGKEQWLPFVNEQGRMLAPNWGRVHSMWANIAVTPNIDSERLNKFIMKVTAFWGRKVGLDLNDARFIIKHKKVVSHVEWQDNLRKSNLSGEWQNIGAAIWQDKRVQINFKAL
jgi:predicted DCC family thiol-disulfide oxidoreductase YuxK